MTTNTRSWIVRHEPERLGRRGINSLYEVDAKFLMKQCQLVYKCDVDIAEDVLKHLRSLCYRRTAHTDYSRLENRAIERGSCLVDSSFKPPTIFGIFVML